MSVFSLKIQWCLPVDPEWIPLRQLFPESQRQSKELEEELQRLSPNNEGN